MTLVRWNPFREVGDWDRSIDRLFDGIFPHGLEKESRRASAWSPTVDVAENGDSLVFSVELPGFAKDGVDISVDDGILTISGERKFDRKEDSRYHRLERRYGQFHRSFRLPNSVDIENAAATLNEGVLQLVVPKREEAKPRQIPVRVN